MGRIFAATFVVVALAVVIGMLALPAMLASQDSTGENYKHAMAAWHVRWSDANSAEERRDLLPALEEIRSPSGSIDMLDRHRVYVQAHVIYSESDDLRLLALEGVAAEVAGSGGGEALECGELVPALEGSAAAGQGGSAVLQAISACALFNSAAKNLVIVRAQASAGWLADEIRAIVP